MRVKTGNGVYVIRAAIPDLRRREFLDLICESLPDESGH